MRNNNYLDHNHVPKKKYANNLQKQIKNLISFNSAYHLYNRNYILLNISARHTSKQLHLIF